MEIVKFYFRIWNTFGKRKTDVRRRGSGENRAISCGHRSQRIKYIRIKIPMYAGRCSWREDEWRRNRNGVDQMVLCPRDIVVACKMCERFSGIFSGIKRFILLLFPKANTPGTKSFVYSIIALRLRNKYCIAWQSLLRLTLEKLTKSLTSAPCSPHSIVYSLNTPHADSSTRSALGRLRPSPSSSCRTGLPESVSYAVAFLMNSSGPLDPKLSRHLPESRVVRDNYLGGPRDLHAQTMSRSGTAV